MLSIFKEKCSCCKELICRCLFHDYICKLCNQKTLCHYENGCKTHKLICRICDTKKHVTSIVYKCAVKDCPQKDTYNMCCFHDKNIQYKRYAKSFHFSRCTCRRIGCFDHTKKCATCKHYKCTKCIDDKSIDNIKIFTCKSCIKRKTEVIKKELNKIIDLSISMDIATSIIMEYLL